MIGISIMENFRLLDVDFFSKLRIAKSRNSVALIRVKAFISNNCKESFVYCQFYNRDISLKTVELFSLLKAASNPSSFVFLDDTVNISFSFQSPFSTQYMLIFGAISSNTGAVCYSRFLFYFYCFPPSVCFM